MAQKTESYVDTGAFIAFLDKSDSFHHLFKRLFSDPDKLVTSSLVISEAHGWFLRRYDAYKAQQFLLFLDDLNIISILAFGSAEIIKAKIQLNKYQDQSLTLADAHGLSIIKERKIRNCWSVDRHFKLSGCRLVIE